MNQGCCSYFWIDWAIFGTTIATIIIAIAIIIAAKIAIVIVIVVVVVIVATTTFAASCISTGLGC